MAMLFYMLACLVFLVQPGRGFKGSQTPVVANPYGCEKNGFMFCNFDDDGRGTCVSGGVDRAVPFVGTAALAKVPDFEYK